MTNPVEGTPDWASPALRSQVRVGTALEMDDGSVYMVQEVVPDGVIVRDRMDPRKLLPWPLLTDLSCRIADWMDLAWEPERGAVVNGLGERFTECRPLTDTEWLGILAGRGDVLRYIALGVVAEVMRVRNSTRLPVTLTARAKWWPIRHYEAVLEEGGVPNPEGVRDARLFTALARLRLETEARLPAGRDTLTLVIMEDEPGWRYEMRFGH